MLNRPLSQSLAAIALQITLFAIAGLYTTGLIRIAIGLSRNKPVGYMGFLCVLVGVYLIWRLQISFRNQQLPLLKGLTDLLYFILWLTLVPLGLFGIFVFVQIFGAQGLLATITGSLLLFCLITGQRRTSRSGSSGRRICGSDCGQCSSTSGNSGCGSGDGGGDAGCGGCGGCGG
ncbi:hypothetical protein [Leptothermofonsia sp. ETS-13]|uniref:hypothetical protein n=1 Tax=Leptothermofonsia sp. ETS-13 TaxID=3035696 RepID=UPI003B9E1246